MNLVPTEFARPGSAYRGKPFWAWNGRLEPEELRRQIRLMHRMGLGGFFMHSRVGLATKYLSKEWFDCVRACVDEAKKLGMEAWLYDEDRWPSGAAGGLVTQNPKYRAKSLVLYRTTDVSELSWDDQTLAAAIAELRRDEAHDVRDVPRGQSVSSLRKGETLLIYRLQTMPTSRWFNGQAYLDTLSHEAVRAFLEVTHEAYRREVGEEFGRVVPGIFTDEPYHMRVLQSGDPFPELSIPWTESFPETFRRRYGYDLLPHITKVFFNVDGRSMHRERYHYHDCLTFLFCDAFGRQIGEWCEKHNLLFTGHTLAEMSLSWQASLSAAMRFYEHMQAPGMDLLMESNREYDTAKQVSSVARQFGRTWRLTETYGCTGWDFPFVGHKALGDWQAALGINLRCQHLSWYTMEGQAKRDYPASIFYQSPWWESYGKVEDYFARLGAVMTRGKEVRDLLVIHPLESMWMLFREGWQDDPDVKEVETGMVRLRDFLLGANLDFDYGDEDILARHGRVRTEDGRLLVGQAEYKAVLVPPLRTIRRSTLALLKSFAAAGGTVVFAGAAPEYVEAEPSEEAKQFAATCPSAPVGSPKLLAALEGACRRVSIRDAKGREIRQTLYLLREDDEAFYLFVCNVGHDYTQPCHVKESNVDWDVLHREPPLEDRTDEFPEVCIVGFGECDGAPVELDPDTGGEYRAQAERCDGRWTIHTSLPRFGSRLFVIPKARQQKIPPRRPVLRDVRRQALRAASWDIQLSEANNLVLDRPKWKIGEGKWNAAEEILRLDRKVRDAVGLKHRGGHMMQPWAQTKPKDCRPADLELSYTFDVQTLPVGELFLALERPELYEVCVNGQAVAADVECGWWVDRSLRKLPVDPTLLRIGTNEVHLRCRYDAEHPGLEIVYLLGDFGVKVKGDKATLTAPVRRLKLGDWVKQGLAFYSGNVTYRRALSCARRKGERLFLRVPQYRGTAVRVFVNGQSVGVIAWEPAEVDLTPYWKPGQNELAIQVLGHRRNSHGPLHYAGRPRWTGPAEFVSEGKNWTNDYYLVPAGLFAPPELIARK